VEVYRADELQGTWRVEAIAGGTLTLEADANLIEGDTWQGVYRFDHVIVQSGGALRSDDPVLTEELTVQSGGQVDLQDPMTIPTMHLGGGAGTTRVFSAIDVPGDLLIGGPGGLTELHSSVKAGGRVEILGAVDARSIEAAELIVRSGGELSHPTTPNMNSAEHLELDIAGTLTVEAGGFIDVSERGYPENDRYPGEPLTSDYYAGGSHLGQGGNNSEQSTYGSVEKPLENGAGGRNNGQGGGVSGGGSVRIQASSVVLDGDIRANGQSGYRYYPHAGAGGSVWIAAEDISGSASITAKGGRGEESYRGSGGGGAITIEYVTLGLPRDRLLTPAGDFGRLGGAGTLFLRGPENEHTFGELIVDNEGLEGTWTTLPPLGTGVAQDGTFGTTLVTDLTSIQQYFVGHWVEVYRADELQGTWRVEAIAGGTLTLEADANLIEGDTWQGVYRFDKVTVQGMAKLRSDDPIRADVFDVAPDSELVLPNDSGPEIGDGQVVLFAANHSFWVSAPDQTITDDSGIASVTVRNVTRDWETTVTPANGGFTDVELVETSQVGDEIEITAVDAHENPLSSTESVGTLPANAAAPVVTDVSIVVQPDSKRVTGVATDDEVPVSISVVNDATTVSYTGEADAAGLFSINVEGSGGDSFTLTATDAHPVPLSTTIAAGTLPSNPAPVIHPDLIKFTYEEPSMGEVPEPAHYSAMILNDAITDDDLADGVDIVFRNQRDGTEWEDGYWGGNEEYQIRRYDWTTGDTIELTVTDHDAQDPSSTTVVIGTLPADNWGPPVLNTSDIDLKPMGYGFHLIGEEAEAYDGFGSPSGWALDADWPLTVVAFNTTSGWQSEPLVVQENEPLYMRVIGEQGNVIELQVTDGHPVEPQTMAAPQLVDNLPEYGITDWSIPLDGHSATEMRDGYAIVDGGSGIVSTAEAFSSSVSEALYDGVTATADVIHNPLRVTISGPEGDSTYDAERVALDGTDLVGWTWVDDGNGGLIPETYRQTVTAGSLALGQVLGTMFVMVAEDAPGLSVLTREASDYDADTMTWLPACTASDADLSLPNTAGLSALALIPALDGQTAVLVDDPLAELRLFDLSQTGVLSDLGSINLAGSGVPVWSVWKYGRLIVGRADGTVDVLSWTESSLETVATWASSGTPVSAALIADQLFVGLNE
ncbi:MAG: hypothetical protein GY906_36610, partial [bacterium]|nr:hypothetical protein [bacterium]